LLKIKFVIENILSVDDATVTATSLGTFSIRKLSNFLVSCSFILKNV
jgi:hypothetical protein